MSKARRAAVAAAVRAIRAFHRLGRRLPPRRPPKEGYGDRAMDAAAGEHGLNPETLRKARRFADPDGGYTPDELDTLCRLVRSVQSGQDDGLPVFGRTHVIRLLGVPKRRRPRLQASAIRGGWSTADLEAAIAAEYGSRRAGGRRPRLPADALGLLAEVERLCERWRRWAAVLDRTPATGKDDPLLHLVPPQVRELVSDASAAMARLHRATTAELTAMRPRRDARHHFRPARG